MACADYTVTPLAGQCHGRARSVLTLELELSAAVPAEGLEPDEPEVDQRS